MAVEVQVPDELLHGLDIDRQVRGAVIAGWGRPSEQAVEHLEGCAIVKHPRLRQMLDDGQRAVGQGARPMAGE
ncbi:hypothetical protein D3C79_969020 [compost metagenome]